MTIEDWLSLAGSLVGGFSIGWLIKSRTAAQKIKKIAASSAHEHLPPHERMTRSSLALSHQLEETRTAIVARQRELRTSEEQLATETARLAERQDELRKLRTQLGNHDEEQASLQTRLGEQRGQVAKVSADLYRLEQEIIRRKEEKTASLGTVQERNRELEMLTQITAGYEADVDELTQAIQLTDGEVLRLKTVLQTKEEELAEAKSLLKRRDANLNELIKAREETERKIAQEQEHHGLVAREHDRLLDQLRDLAEDTDQRARLLLALQNEGHPDAGALREDVGYPDPDGLQYKTIRTLPELPAPEEEGTLAIIKGIGEGYASLLKAAGVRSFDDLASLRPEEVRQIIEGPQWRTPDVESWIAEARALALVHDDDTIYEDEEAKDMVFDNDDIDEELDDGDYIQGLTDWDDDAPEE